jgi:hypothetical protein
MKTFLKALALCFVATGALAQSVNTNVGGWDNGVSITPVVSTTAYSASQAVGGLQRANVFRSANPGSAILDAFLLASTSGVTQALTVYIFDTNPSASTCTNQATFVLANADVPKLAVAPFVLAPATAQGATQSFAEQALVRSVQNHDTSGAYQTALYVCLVAGGALTPGSASDISYKLMLSQD